MTKYSIILTNLVNALAEGRTVLYTQVYSTFLRIPDVILSSHQKIICIAFMQLGEASNIVKDSLFQVGINSMAKQCGLTRDQFSKAIKTLPEALENARIEGYLGDGEAIKFVIKDIHGREVKKNVTGLASCYEFEYQSPRLKKKVGIELSPTADIKTGNQKYDKSQDPQLALKQNEFQRLKLFFSSAEMEQFLKYPYDKIVYTVDYYLKEREKKVLSLGWLKLAFENYEIQPDAARERLLKSAEWLNGLHKRIKNLAESKELQFKHLNISQNGVASKYHVLQFATTARLQDMFEDNMKKLNEDEVSEMAETAPVIYEKFKENFARAGLDSFAQSERHIKFAIVNLHFNLI